MKGRGGGRGRGRGEMRKEGGERDRKKGKGRGREERERRGRRERDRERKRGKGERGREERRRGREHQMVCLRSIIQSKKYFRATQSQPLKTRSWFTDGLQMVVINSYNWWRSCGYYNDKTIKIIVLLTLLGRACTF